MQHIRRILVAIKDPKARSSPALVKAAQLAHACGADLELFHCIADTLYVDPPRRTGDVVRQAERETRALCLEQLELIAGRLRRDGHRVTSSAEWDFPPHEGIVRRATRIGADLIVAERHSRRHVAPWLLRYADWELLRLSPVPVLLVKNRRAYARPAIVAAVDPTHAYAKPENLDVQILRIAESFASSLNGSLHAVHAYPPIPVSTTLADWNTPKFAAHLRSEAAARAKVSVERLLHDLNIPPRRRHLIASDPVSAIEKVTRRMGNAIVVMGAISRSGRERAFIGNTAERVLDHLRCDVLIVKPRNFPNRVPRTRRGPRNIARFGFPETL
jgi:universal stress protein E